MSEINAENNNSATNEKKSFISFFLEYIFSKTGSREEYEQLASKLYYDKESFANTDEAFDELICATGYEKVLKNEELDAIIQRYYDYETEHCLEPFKQLLYQFHEEGHSKVIFEDLYGRDNEPNEMLACYWSQKLLTKDDFANEKEYKLFHVRWNEVLEKLGFIVDLSVFID
jgi:hypothetical protein